MIKYLKYLWTKEFSGNFVRRVYIICCVSSKYLPCPGVGIVPALDNPLGHISHISPLWSNYLRIVQTSHST